MTQRLRILAIDPFHGGSHRAFLGSVTRHSRHEWRVVKGKPVHWKWRMRSAPLEMAGRVRAQIQQSGYPDAVFCTDMLDLPTFRGLLRDTQFMSIPTVAYFHENQWSYPVSPQARVDAHFGYTNLLTAFAADSCWFNSSFHRNDFLESSKQFIAQMPDARAIHDFDSLQTRCSVHPPGFETRNVDCAYRDSPPLTLGWVSRWEHDKRPDQFAELLERVDRAGIDFRLVLLGSRRAGESPDLSAIKHQFGDRIIHDGYASTHQEYWEALAKIDAVVSTADHEFFGIAICEAIWAGAVPVLPKRLNYPDLATEDCLYKSLSGATRIIQSLQNRDVRKQISAACRHKISGLRAAAVISTMDDALSDLCDLRLTEADGNRTHQASFRTPHRF